MKEKQLKYWVKANPLKMPECHVVAHAGGAQYLVEVELKKVCTPLRDNGSNDVLRFDNLLQARTRLRELGIKKSVLRLLDPYDEMCVSGSCYQDIVIPI